MKTLITVIATVLTLAAAPASAQPQGDRARAQELLREGNELLDKQQYASALAKFQAAYDAFPSPMLLLNIGTSLRSLGRNAEAANAYARWIRAKTNPQKLAEVEEALRELDKQVARIEIEVSEPGAKVTVDGQSLDAALEVVRLEPGSHTISAQKDGFKPATQTIQAAAGQSESITLTLERDPTTTPDPEQPAAGTEPGAGEPDTTITQSPEGGSGTVLKIAGISTAAVGLVALGVGVKYGLDAKSINEDLESVDSSGAWTPELLAKEDEGKSAEKKLIIFTAVGGAAIIAGGVLSYLGFTTGGDASEDSLAVAPSIGAESLGWVISGRF